MGDRVGGTTDYTYTLRISRQMSPPILWDSGPPSAAEVVAVAAVGQHWRWLQVASTRSGTTAEIRTRMIRCVG